MEGVASSQVTARAGKEPGHRRRIWSAEEEEVLVNSLREIVVTGWKCENGFRTGYLKILEKSMRKAFPNSDIRAQPHIDSKIHVWRKNHSSLSTMLSRSGFGWDDANKKIKVESPQIWDEYVKTDGNAKGMLNKSYPMYHAWQEIFGKERATGEHAEDLQTAQNAPLASGEQLGSQEPIHGVDGSPMETENEITSVCGPSKAAAGNQTIGKKRKSIGTSEGEFAALMEKFCEKIDQRLGDLSTRIGYEMKMSEHRANLFKALGSLGVLNAAEQIYIHKLLSNNNKDCEAFFNLPETARAQMVRMMCDGQL